MTTTLWQTSRRALLALLALLLAVPVAAQTAGDDPAPVRAERVHSHETHDDVQRAEITVLPGGYEPSAIALEAGVPAELVFTRPAEAGCGDEVQIPDFGVEKTTLPVGEAVTVRFTPEEPGTYTFTCGMNMLRGTLLVE
jgi:plastocyanin domain-containing protein